MKFKITTYEKKQNAPVSKRILTVGHACSPWGYVRIGFDLEGVHYIKFTEENNFRKQRGCFADEIGEFNTDSNLRIGASTQSLVPTITPLGRLFFFKNIEPESSPSSGSDSLLISKAILLNSMSEYLKSPDTLAKIVMVSFLTNMMEFDLDDDETNAASHFFLHAHNRTFNEMKPIPLILTGTSFELSVWKQLARVPYGTKCSYGDIAAQIGKPKAYRAVGTAIGKNPLSLVLPCHRIIQQNGNLGSYRWGVKRKARILQWENLCLE